MLSGLAKFLIGVVLGIVLFTGTTVAVAYFFLNKLAAAPPKPVYAEEQGQANASAQNKLEPGAYYAKVTWKEGLTLRGAPSADVKAVGSLLYDQRIIVLTDSQDKKWQKVRLEEGNSQGWIKAGNIERVEQ